MYNHVCMFECHCMRSVSEANISLHVHVHYVILSQAMQKEFVIIIIPIIHSIKHNIV